MYAQHFGLSQDPFSIAPDPRYLFMSERHREALAHLLYGVAGTNRANGGFSGGFVLLTGDIGTGKTTICRCFLEQIPPNCQVAYIFNPKLSVTELLQSICEEFHITLEARARNTTTIKDYIDALNIFLLQSHAGGQSSVLIIDEAQSLAPDVLEQLRLLTNLETNERKLLQIVLIGQPELRSMLERPELEQLAQRVIARFHLAALSSAESALYISHRLGVAGHTGALPFDAKALQQVHRLTQGVPRRINLLCGRALLGAWATGMLGVNRSVVDKAATEVFGGDPKPIAGTTQQRMRYALAGFALLSSAVLAGFLLWPGPQTKQRVNVVAASKPQTASSKAIQVEVLAAAPIEEMQTLWPQLPSDISAAWRELAPTWGLTANDGDPCQAARAQQWQCYRTGKLTVPLLRQLGRPGILTLQTGNDSAVYAVLVGLSDQTATLRVAGRLRTVRLVLLTHLWRGDFATFWQAPAGYSAGLSEGSSGAAIDWLANRLTQLDGVTPLVTDSVPIVLDMALRSRVRAFQRTRGITPDGLPGPMTFMQIESATRSQAPRLLTDLR